MKTDTTLAELNEIHDEWMKMPCDIDRKKLAEWERTRWIKIPESYLSLCDNETAAAITYNIIITAAFIGYHITERDAVEIAALFSGDNLTETIRNYCSAYES